MEVKKKKIYNDNLIEDDAVPGKKEFMWSRVTVKYNYEKNNANDTVEIQWDLVKTSDLIKKLRTHDSQNSTICLSNIYVHEKMTYVLSHLKAGETYNYRICERDFTRNDTDCCQHELHYFTTIPNPPGGFTSVLLSDKEIEINWLPPLIPCSLSHYQVSHRKNSHLYHRVKIK